MEGMVGKGVLPWCESAGDGEQDDFLVGPLLAGVVLLGTAAGSWVIVGDWCPPTKLLESCGVVVPRER